MSEEQARTPTALSREELYEKVWQTTLSHLAQQFGICGTGLAKICRRMNVPYPPQGHWAKLAAGKKVAPIPLPAAGPATPSRVSIAPTPPQTRPSIPLKAEGTEALAAGVPERLLRPHPIVASWLADHERRRKEAKNERDPWMRNLKRVEDFTATDRRQHRILDSLFKVLERHGAKVRQDERHQLFVEINGEKVEFQLRERLKQTRRPLTEDEKRWHPRDTTRQELVPTSKLVFAIKTYIPSGFRREWLETDEKAMEAHLPDIAATIIALGPALAEQTRLRREEARERQIAEQRRYEEQQRRKLDRNRWRRVVEIAEEWREAKLAREFIAALRQTGPDLEQTIGERTIRDWLAWAEERASSLDPVACGTASAFERVASVTSWEYRD